jgi:DNA-binding NtrC family response regulator
VEAEDMSTPAIVLIVSTLPIIESLLGTYVALQGNQAAFRDGHGESAQEAVDRHRPQLIIVDVEHQDGFSPAAFIQRQRDRGIPVLAFSGSRDEADIRAAAEPYKIPWFALPIEQTRFAAIVAAAFDSGCGGVA